MDDEDNIWRPIAKAVPESRGQLTSVSASLREVAAAKATKVLLGCYRSGEANDPEVYTTAVMAVLAQYPEDIIRAVCDPRTGLPGRLKWLPTVSEVREACDEFVEADMAAVRREREWSEQLHRRKEWEAFQEVKKTRPSLDELKAKYGPNWGLKGDPRRVDRSAPLDPEWVRNQLGVTPDVWAAIPDAKR